MAVNFHSSQLVNEYSTFLMGRIVILNRSDFFGYYSIMKCANIWKMYMIYSVNQQFSNDQLISQNHAWVKKDPFKIRGRPVTNIWNVYQYDFRFCIAIDLYETATCQVWTSIKEYLQFLFQPHNLCESRYSAYASTQTTYCNRLNIEANTRLQLSSFNLDIKEICKNIKHGLVINLSFIFLENSCFS